MLDLKNITLQDINQNKKLNANFVRMKNLMDVKMASYLRYLGTKNAINRASDYHYLCLAVTDSTAPVNGIDYIHPSVKPVVDYATAVITKGLAPNGDHPLQQAWVAEGVPQCGYCQSGQIMTAAALLKKTPKPSRKQIVDAMAGNICRCGTYNQIVRAVERAANTKA